MVHGESQDNPDEKEAAISVLQKLVNNNHVHTKEVCEI